MFSEIEAVTEVYYCFILVARIVSCVKIFNKYIGMNK